MKASLLPCRRKLRFIFFSLGAGGDVFTATCSLAFPSLMASVLLDPTTGAGGASTRCPDNPEYPSSDEIYSGDGFCS